MAEIVGLFHQFPFIWVVQVARCRRLSYFLCRCLFNGRWLVLHLCKQAGHVSSSFGVEGASPATALQNLEERMLVFPHAGGDWRAARPFRLITRYSTCSFLAVRSTQHVWRMRPVSRFCQLQVYYITSPVPRHSRLSHSHSCLRHYGL